MLLAAVLLSMTTALPAQADSATILVKPNDPATPSLAWVAFDDSRRPVARGVAPGRIAQAADGVAVTYCAEQAPGWLELVVEIRKGGRKGQMRAWGACTRVVVRGIAVQTTGVADPRLPSAKAGADR